MFELDGQHRAFGVTAIENLFITEYLPGADGDYVKVYLSALYHCQQGDHSFSLQDMEQELGLSSDRIEAALRYWERRHLVARVSDKPLRYRFYHLAQRMLTGQDAQAGDKDFVDFSEAIYALFQGRRKVRPNEIATAHEWVTELELPREVVLMLLSHLMDTRGASFSFKAAQKLAVLMRESNITSPEEAEGYLSHTRQAHEGAKAVIRRFNQRRLPTEDELALYRKWTEEWGFTGDNILSACAETVKASNPSFGYLNGVLDGLRRRSSEPVKSVAQQLAREGDSMAGAKEVLAALGTRISPSTVLKAYEALLKQAPQALIVYAAQQVAQRRGRFEDIEKQLKTWRDQGIRTLDEARKAAPGAGYQRPAKTVAAQRYGQRSYTEDELSQSVRDMLKEAREYDEQ